VENGGAFFFCFIWRVREKEKARNKVAKEKKTTSNGQEGVI
jgi:hypothetical protein